MRSSPGTDEPSVEELQTQLADTEDRYLRARADLENYRRRAERELERRVTEQRDELIRSWLEVVDTVERALAAESRDELRALLEQMDALLARYGVTRVGEVGEPFDPELHEAVAADADTEAPVGTITSVARSGYSAGDRVVRPAQVAVSAPSPDGG